MIKPMGKICLVDVSLSLTCYDHQLKDISVLLQYLNEATTIFVCALLFHSTTLLKSFNNSVSDVFRSTIILIVNST